MIDIPTLRRLHEAATPGPWRGDRLDGTVKYQILGGPEGDEEVSVCSGDNGNNALGGPYGFHSDHDEALVMALRNALPALLDELEALRRVRDAADVMRSAVDAVLLDADVNDLDRARLEDARRIYLFAIPTAKETP